jgi:hypothetical protein
MKEVEKILTSIWEWDEGYPAFQAYKNPKNVIEQCLKVHEDFEYNLLKSHYHLHSIDFQRFFKKYQLAHAKANKKMIEFMRTKIQELEECSDSSIKNVINYYWHKYYPVHKREQDYRRTQKNNLKDKDVKAKNIIYFYILEKEKRSYIIGY